jgi:osmoprotectant transport system permease protein
VRSTRSSAARRHGRRDAHRGGGSVTDELRLLPDYLTAHLQLALVALLLGALVSVPTGIWLVRHKRGEQLVLGIASVIQTIPALALLAIMVPVLALISGALVRTIGVEIRSIGYLPAIIGLTLYSILPILRNTVAGLDGVDPALIEAARGVGMTPAQRLRIVQLPLALPVIVAGIRTAAVWVVGMATLSTPVGAPSLGNYIFSGLQTRNFTAVLIGCVAAAALALVLDTLVRALELGLRERRRRLVVTALAVLLALYAYTAATFALSFSGGSATGRPIQIGAKTFSEQYILSEIMAQQITRRTGKAAVAVPSLGSTIAFDALRTAQLDAYVDYTGTIWATIMHRDDVPDRDAVLREVADFLAAKHGIALTGALGFENAYALAMRGAHARSLDIDTISALTPHAGGMAIGGDYEFFTRAEWRALERLYGLAFREQRSMDSSLMYEAVANGQVDVISAFSTDGRIAAYDLRVLDDDRHAIPPYDAIILASGRLAREQPDVVAALRELAGTIDADRMRAMNLAVDRDGVNPAQVARDFIGSLPVEDGKK